MSHSETLAAALFSLFTFIRKFCCDKIPCFKFHISLPLHSYKLRILWWILHLFIPVLYHQVNNTIIHNLHYTLSTYTWHLKSTVLSPFFFSFFFVLTLWVCTDNKKRKNIVVRHYMHGIQNAGSYNCSITVYNAPRSSTEPWEHHVGLSCSPSTLDNT